MSPHGCVLRVNARKAQADLAGAGPPMKVQATKLRSAEGCSTILHGERLCSAKSIVCMACISLTGLRPRDDFRVEGQQNDGSFKHDLAKQDQVMRYPAGSARAFVASSLLSPVSTLPLARRAAVFAGLIRI
jgi:hypothetical protein